MLEEPRSGAVVARVPVTYTGTKPCRLQRVSEFTVHAAIAAWNEQCAGWRKNVWKS